MEGARECTEQKKLRDEIVVNVDGEDTSSPLYMMQILAAQHDHNGRQAKKHLYYRYRVSTWAVRKLYAGMFAVIWAFLLGSAVWSLFASNATPIESPGIKISGSKITEAKSIQIGDGLLEIIPKEK